MRLEAQANEINHNMNLLMEALQRNIGPFGDDGGSNLDIRSKGKSGYQEEPRKESRKESKKE